MNLQASPNLNTNAAASIVFTPLNRSNDILRAIEQTINALATGLIDDRTARTILYGLQIASANMKRAGKEATDASHYEMEQQSAVGDVDSACDHETSATADAEPGHEAITSIEAHDAKIDDATSDEGPMPCRTLADFHKDERAETQRNAAPHIPLRSSGISPMQRLRMRQQALAGRELTRSQE